AALWGPSAHLDAAEEPVGLAVRAGREVERSRSAVAPALRELECPEAVDLERPVVGTPQLAVVHERVRRRLAEGVDVPVAEVPDEQVACERAEARRSHRQAPR